MSSEATRITLIKCMRKLVRERSFTKISIESICDAAHVSKRTFYRYFPDKYALLNEAFRYCFFSRIEIADEDLFWDIFGKICAQVYSEREFFSHAFGVKGQNGFWEETPKLLKPYMLRDLPSNDITDKLCRFFVDNDINMLLTLLEEWIRDGFTMPPDEFYEYIRGAFSVYGKWVYEVATDRPRSEFTMEKYLGKEW